MMSVTTRTIRNYLKDGTLIGKKLGGQWRFTADDIKNFLEKGEISTMIANEMKSMANDFVNNINVSEEGDARVCITADLAVSQELANEKSFKICELVNQSEGINIEYKFHYYMMKKVARYLIVAPPAFAEEALGLLK